MKLTNHIALRYIGVATIVLLISVPLFYVVLQRVMWNSIDESLRFQKEWTEEQLKNISPEHFVSFNNDIIILPRLFPKIERYYNEKIYIPYDKEMVTYRVLEFNTKARGIPYAVRIQKSLVESEDVLQAIAAMQIGVYKKMFGYHFIKPLINYAVIESMEKNHSTYLLLKLRKLIA